MIHVSVPCQCGADISFASAACPGCKSPVSRALRDDLDARLEYAHTEYGEARQRLRRSTMALFVLGAIYVVIALFLIYALGSEPAASIDSLVVTLPFLSNGVIGLMFIACAAWSRRSPTAAFSVALGIWLVTQTLMYVTLPALFLMAFLSAGGIAGLFAKVVLLFFLSRALFAARRVDEIRTEVARGSTA
ncbi:hypothetical protein [Polyangium sp. y55x31]|uniref:hypothetical protein n=1 Tax=Polyangium sp. y55x31 TaxID=3042688 RepID=UPI002482C3B4|nr:hypothetical protein [Polyangium sp. y55x31]MDI1480941.1 hypothetical protein [Polyangium sp. y55x31]